MLRGGGGLSELRCFLLRATMAHTRQPRLDSGPDFLALVLRQKPLKPFQLLTSLGSRPQRFASTRRRPVGAALFPPPSDYDTYKTAKARFRPGLSGLGSQIKALNAVSVAPSSLGSSPRRFVSKKPGPDRATLSRAKLAHITIKATFWPSFSGKCPSNL